MTDQELERRLLLIESELKRLRSVIERKVASGKVALSEQSEAIPYVCGIEGCNGRGCNAYGPLPCRPKHLEAIEAMQRVEQIRQDVLATEHRRTIRAANKKKREDE